MTKNGEKKYRFEYFRSLVALLLTAIVIVGGCSEKTDSEVPRASAFPDSVVNDEYLVRVNHHPIMGKELRVFTLMYGAGTPDSLFDRGFNLRMLDGLIDRTLIWQEAVALGIAVEDSIIHWYTRELTKAIGGPQALEDFIKSTEIERMDVEQIIRKDLIVREFLDVKISSGIQVSDSIARAYYDDNVQEFAMEDSVRARHIILRSSPQDDDSIKEQKIGTLRDLRDRILAGEDFALLAQKHSEGPSGPKGGDLGVFTRRDMVRPFSNAAFALKPGQVSDVVETNFGYHLILVEEKLPGKIFAFQEIKPQLMQQIHNYSMQIELRNHLQRSRAVAIIERNF